MVVPDSMANKPICSPASKLFPLILVFTLLIVVENVIGMVPGETSDSISLTQEVLKRRAQQIKDFTPSFLNFVLSIIK